MRLIHIKKQIIVLYKSLFLRFDGQFLAPNSDQADVTAARLEARAHFGPTSEMLHLGRNTAKHGALKLVES